MISREQLEEEALRVAAQRGAERMGWANRMRLWRELAEIGPVETPPNNIIPDRNTLMDTIEEAILMAQGADDSLTRWDELDRALIQLNYLRGQLKAP